MGRILPLLDVFDNWGSWLNRYQTLHIARVSVYGRRTRERPQRVVFGQGEDGIVEERDPQKSFLTVKVLGHLAVRKSQPTSLRSL